MIVKSTPLKLQRYFVTELFLKANPRRSPTGDPVEYEPEDLEIKIASAQDSGAEWRFELTVRLKKELAKEKPYNFKIVLTSWFTFNISVQHNPDVVRINALSMLYSAARELLLGASSRTPYPPLQLPTVRFVPPSPPESEVKAPGNDATIEKPQ